MTKGSKSKITNENHAFQILCLTVLLYTASAANPLFYIIIIISLFKEDYILSKHTYLTYGPL